MILFVATFSFLQEREKVRKQGRRGEEKRERVGEDRRGREEGEGVREGGERYGTEGGRKEGREDGRERKMKRAGGGKGERGSQEDRKKEEMKERRERGKGEREGGRSERKEEGRNLSIKFLPVTLLLAYSFKNVTLIFSSYHLQRLQCLCLRGYVNFLLDINHLISDFRKST